MKTQIQIRTSAIAKLPESWSDYAKEIIAVLCAEGKCGPDDPFVCAGFQVWARDESEHLRKQAKELADRGLQIEEQDKFLAVARILRLSAGMTALNP